MRMSDSHDQTAIQAVEVSPETHQLPPLASRFCAKHPVYQRPTAEPN